MLTPQAVGTFEDALGGRCALASAVDAVGRSLSVLGNYDEWKWTKRSTNCPECQRTAPVAYAIMHLNDHHLWNRERIAQWVAEIEPTEDTSLEGEEFAPAV